MIELLVEIGRNWLLGSWKVSTVLIFFILSHHLIILYKDDKLAFDSFRDTILSYSRISGGIIFVLGGVVGLTSLHSLMPDNFLLGEFLALFYFAYLFYEY